MKTTISALLITRMSTSAFAGTKAQEDARTKFTSFSCRVDAEHHPVEQCDVPQGDLAASIRVILGDRVAAGENGYVLAVVPALVPSDGAAGFPALARGEDLSIIPQIASREDLSIIPHISADAAYGLCMTEGMVIFDGVVLSYDDAPSTGTCAKWAWGLTNPNTREGEVSWVIEAGSAEELGARFGGREADDNDIGAQFGGREADDNDLAGVSEEVVKKSRR